MLCLGLLQNLQPLTGHHSPTTDHRTTDRFDTNPPTTGHRIPTHQQIYHRPTGHRSATTSLPIGPSPTTIWLILLQQIANPLINQPSFNRVTIGPILFIGPIKTILLIELNWLFGWMSDCVDSFQVNMSFSFFISLFLFVKSNRDGPKLTKQDW